MNDYFLWQDINCLQNCDQNRLRERLIFFTDFINHVLYENPDTQIKNIE